MVADITVSSPRWSDAEWTEFSNYLRSNASRLPAATRAGLLRVVSSAPPEFRAPLQRLLSAPEAASAESRRAAAEPKVKAVTFKVPMTPGMDAKTVKRIKDDEEFQAALAAWIEDYLKLREADENERQ